MYWLSRDGKFWVLWDDWIYKQKWKVTVWKYTRISHKMGDTKQLHIMLANMFLPNPDMKPQVNHKNWLKHDNRVKNLEWVTPQENCVHAYKTGLHPIENRYIWQQTWYCYWGANKLWMFSKYWELIEVFERSGIAVKMFNLSKSSLYYHISRWDLYNWYIWKYVK